MKCRHHLQLQAERFSKSYTFGAGGFGGSISKGKEKINSNYNSVIEQTAIQAGNGGFNINVAGNTHLKGAVIDSSLAAQTQGNNQLTTATLTTENIENKGEYTASNSTMGINLNGNTNTGTDDPAGGSIGSSLKAGLGGMGVGDSGEAHGTTKSAIANADITITDDAAQQDLTGQDAATTVATLNRDTQHANGSIENPFNLEKVQEQLEFLQVAGETLVVPAMAQAAKWIGDQFPPDPEHPERIDPAKILAHAALGAAVSQLLGTGWQTGAAAGALGDVLPAVLAKAFEKDENGKIKDEAAFKAATAIISALLASGSGTDLAQTINAAMVTQNAVANNYLTHQQIVDKEEKLAAAKTSAQKTAIQDEYLAKDANQQKAFETCFVDGNCDSVMRIVGVANVLEELKASCQPPKVCSADAIHSITQIETAFNEGGGLVNIGEEGSKLLIELMAAEVVIGGVVLKGGSALIARAFPNVAERLAYVFTKEAAVSLDPIVDTAGNSVVRLQASVKYSFETGPGIGATGASLETSAKQFVQDDLGKNLVGFFETKLAGNQGLDLAYAKTVNGEVQLVIGEAKAGDSALTALGSTRQQTLDRNLAELQKSIERSSLGDSVKESLVEQIKRQTYQVELYTSPTNAVKAVSRFNETLVQRLGQTPSRVIQFERK